MTAEQKAQARANARADYTQRMLLGMRIARGHAARESRDEHRARCRELRRFERLLRKGTVKKGDVQKALQVLSQPMDRRQPDMFGPVPRVGRDTRSDDAHESDAAALEGTDASQSGMGPSGSGPHAGSTAAKNVQLVACRLTEHGTDTHGE